MYKWRLKFQRCDSSGGYWGNDGWFEISVFADTYNSALKKAKEATGCSYVRAVTSIAEEIACPNCDAKMDGRSNVPRTDGDGNG